MKNFRNLIIFVLILIATVICFIFTLFFGIAGISAISQVTFQQLIVLFSFCIIFSIVGNSFLTIADLLYAKARRCA